MNITVYNKILVGMLSLLVISLAGIAAWQQQPLWIFIPALLLGAYLLLQYPEVLFYVLVGSIPWSLEYHFSNALGTDLPDEPLMLLAAFAALIMVISHRKSLAAKSVPLLLFLVGAQLSWTFVTVLLSTGVFISLKYFLAKSWYLLAFFVLPLFLFNDPKVIRRTGIVLALSMFLAVLFVLYKHSAFGFSFEKVNTALEPFYRNHVNYSALLVCTIPIVLAGLRISRKNRLWLVAAGLVMLAALYLSYSRGAWLALIIGMISYGLLQQKWMVNAFVLFIGLSIGSILWLQHNDRYLQYAPQYSTTIFHTNFEEHLVATYQMKDLSTAERYFRWIGGARMVKDSWLTGLGPNTFYDNYKPYTIPAFKTYVSKNEEHSTVHNYFLLMLIEQGAMGLLLFLATIIIAFREAQVIYHRTTDPFWKSTIAAIVAILAMICTVNFLSDLIESDKVGPLFYLCLAILIIAHKRTKTDVPMKVKVNL
ncbi:MAG TPA: O-antigen ligase family protein [Flavisolibacter sp.]|nr:O-antigen ligase family protein [Flavisolibacter sp.]